MDAPDDVAMLEAMAISGSQERGTADGGAGVNLADSDLPKEGSAVTAVNKENQGAQRAHAAQRSSAVGATIFGAAATDQPSGGDTQSLSASSSYPAAAAASRARPLTATYITLFFDREQRACSSASSTNSAEGRFLCVCTELTRTA